MKLLQKAIKEDLRSIEHSGVHVSKDRVTVCSSTRAAYVTKRHDDISDSLCQLAEKEGDFLILNGKPFLSFISNFLEGSNLKFSTNKNKLKITYGKAETDPSKKNRKSYSNFSIEFSKNVKPREENNNKAQHLHQMLPFQDHTTLKNNGNRIPRIFSLVNEFQTKEGVTNWGTGMGGVYIKNGVSYMLDFNALLVSDAPELEVGETEHIPDTLVSPSVFELDTDTFEYLTVLENNGNTFIFITNGSEGIIIPKMSQDDNTLIKLMTMIDDTKAGGVEIAFNLMPHAINRIKSLDEWGTAILEFNSDNTVSIIVETSKGNFNEVVGTYDPNDNPTLLAEVNNRVNCRLSVIYRAIKCLKVTVHKSGNDNFVIKGLVQQQNENSMTNETQQQETDQEAGEVESEVAVQSHDPSFNVNVNFYAVLTVGMGGIPTEESVTEFVEDGVEVSTN